MSYGKEAYFLPMLDGRGCAKEKHVSRYPHIHTQHIKEWLKEGK